METKWETDFLIVSANQKKKMTKRMTNIAASHLPDQKLLLKDIVCVSDREDENSKIFSSPQFLPAIKSVRYGMRITTAVNVQKNMIPAEMQILVDF